MNEDPKASPEEVNDRADAVLEMAGALSAVAAMQEELERVNVEMALLEGKSGKKNFSV
jgi:hypothetical protein